MLHTDNCHLNSKVSQEMQILLICCCLINIGECQKSCSNQYINRDNAFFNMFVVLNILLFYNNLAYLKQPNSPKQ